MSGTSPSCSTVIRTASAIGASASGSIGRSLSTSAGVRIGSAITGPLPGTIVTSTPASSTGTTMSENRIAASTP